MTKSCASVDVQCGSTGKGLMAGYLALTRNPDTAVCNFGPNAGHTTVLDDGREVVVQMLPSAIVSPSVKNVLIGPGAIVDPITVSYTHLRAHETPEHLVCRLLLEKKKKKTN